MDLKARLVEQLEALDVPGAQLGVLRNGEMTTVCAGLADVRSESTVQPSTTFQIASVTKPMNALVAARLSARGSVDFGSACLLGRLIEVVTDLSYEGALRLELVDPMGMTATGFVHDRPPAGMATGYQAQEPLAEAPLWASRALGPAGASVWSNVGDLLRMARVLVSADEAYFSPRWRKWLLEVTVDLSIPPFMDAWCRSLSMFRWLGGPIWGWVGVCTGFRAFWLPLPTRGCAVVLLVNSDRGAELYRALLPSLMDDLGVNVRVVDPTPTPRRRDDLSRYCGRYAWPDSEILVELDSAGLQMSGAAEGALVPISDQLFRWPNGEPDFPFVTFAEPDSDGKPRLIYHAVWAYPRA